MYVTFLCFCDLKAYNSEALYEFWLYWYTNLQASP